MRFVVFAMALWLAGTVAHARTIHRTGRSAATKQSASRSTGHRSRRTSRGGRRSSRRSASRSYQTVPTPDRYRQIQQALADRGYFKGEVNGAWGADSVAALKRFEADRSLTADGKLQARALIELGLGPTRGVAAPSVSGPPPITTEPAAPQPPQREAPPPPPAASAPATGQIQ